MSQLNICKERGTCLIYFMTEVLNDRDNFLSRNVNKLSFYGAQLKKIKIRFVTSQFALT